MNAQFGRLAITAFGIFFAGAAVANNPLTVPNNGTSVLFTISNALTLGGGGTLDASLSDTFSTSTFSGSIESRVYSGDANNAYGGLTFAYQVTMDPNISGDVAHVSLNGLFDNPVDAAYDPGSTGGWVIPVSADEPTPYGSGVAFDLTAPSLSAGATSAWLMVYTGMNGYGRDSASLQDGLNTSANILAPIPEPESIAMLITGLGLMGFIARRRKRSLGA